MNASNGLRVTWRTWAEGLGHADRQAGLRGLLHGADAAAAQRKSVEPMAARVDPLHVPRSTSRFITSSPMRSGRTSDAAARGQWVVPKMDFSDGGWWIIDDTGFPKKGSTRWAWPGSTAGCWASRTTARWR